MASAGAGSTTTRDPEARPELARQILGRPAIRCCRALGISFTSAIGLLAAMAEAAVVEPPLALELLAKLERFGRYDARILEDVARRIRAAPSSKKGGSPS